MVQGEGVPHPGLHEQRGVVDQVIAGHHAQRGEVIAQPRGELSLHMGLPGDQQGQFPQDFRGDVFLAGQRVILGNHQAPVIFCRQAQGVIFPGNGGPQDQAKVQ